MYKMKAWADWENILEDLGDQEAREEVALDYTLAMVYNKGVDQTRYGLIVSELKNDYSKGYQIREFPNLGNVWYNHNSIANILSMKEV